MTFAANPTPHVSPLVVSHWTRGKSTVYDLNGLEKIHLRDLRDLTLFKLWIYFKKMKKKKNEASADNSTVNFCICHKS
jgi:hypothetical protein